MISSLCKRYFPNPHDAEDAAQEVRIHLWKKIGQFRGDSKLKTFIYRVTMNEIFQFMRKGKAQSKRPPAGLVSLEEIQDNRDHPFDPPSPAPDPARVAEALELVERLKTDKLRKALATIETLAFDKTYQEMATARGVHIGTVKSDAYKYRQKLRAALTR